MKNIDFTGIAYIAALAVGGVLAYQIFQKVSKGAPSVAAAAGQVIDQAKQTVSEAVAAVTPTNPDNVVNQGFQKLLKAVTGHETVYDLINSKKPDPVFDGLDNEDRDMGDQWRQVRAGELPASESWPPSEYSPFSGVNAP